MTKYLHLLLINLLLLLLTYCVFYFLYFPDIKKHGWQAIRNDQKTEGDVKWWYREIWTSWVNWNSAECKILLLPSFFLHSNLRSYYNMISCRVLIAFSVAKIYRMQVRSDHIEIRSYATISELPNRHSSSYGTFLESSHLFMNVLIINKPLSSPL